MNIILMDHYAGSPAMGMEFRPYYMAREWVKKGHNVRIVGGDFSHLRIKNPKIRKDFTTQNIDGIKYTWLRTGEYEGNGVKRAESMMRYVGKLYINAERIARAWKPDVVIASSTYPLETYAAKKIAKCAGAKYIHEVHDMWPATLYEIGGMSKKHPFVVMMQAAENSAYKNCDELVALLPYTKKYMVKHGLAPYKFHNIQNGILSQEWADKQPLPDEHTQLFENLKDKFIVLYMGGHALSNALDILLDCAAQEKDSDIAFVLVGDGVEKPRLVKRKNDEKLDNVYFLPPVPKTMVPSLVEKADCSYMGALDSPLYRFGLCLNKMYDCMMAGKPIVCAINAPKTLVEQYDCGFMADPSDVETINSAVHKLKNMTKAQRDEMGQRGKTAVLENFTYEKLAQRFLDIMEKNK